MGTPYAEVIGDPIAHSKSPLIHNFWLPKLGLEGDYRAVRVRESQLADYFESRRADPDWRGCNVTMPLKQAVLGWVNVDPITRRIGAVNTIIHHPAELLVGTNTDFQAINFVLDLQRRKPDRVAVIGAGGAARAVLEELARARVPWTLMINRTEAKARALLDAFGLVGDVATLGVSPEADMLVNASPLGMSGFPQLDIGLSKLSTEATVMEMVYEPRMTSLLERAQARDLETIDGLTVLMEQAAMAFTYFFKVAPDTTDTSELRRLLTQ